MSTSSLQLRAITSFSQGFYILKETVDGRTELDMYGQTGLSEDLLTGICGAPLAGKPSNLSITYDQCYIDEETQEMSGANMIHVFTDANEYRGFSSEDMKEVFNNETITFDGLTADEEPYTMVRGSFCIYFLSSEGVRGIYGSDFGMTSGRFGLTADGGIGASKFMLPVGGGMMVGYYYWNDIAHALYMTDYNAISVMPVMYDAGDVDESSLRCIACGVNVVGYMETDCFVCEDVNTGERYLYLIDGNTGQVTTPKKLDADLHLAQGDIVAVNGCSATYIYTVHENKVYAYNWNENSEFQVLLPGLPEDESIVYLSNQYLNISWGDTSTNFDNLIVATEIDGNYKLYFYDSLIGGIPTEEATVVEGTGRVKSVRYVSGVVSGSDFTIAFPGDLPIYPYTD